MKRIFLTALFPLMTALPLFSESVTVTLDGSDFLSAVSVRKPQGNRDAVTIPESVVEPGDDVDLLIHFDADEEVPQGNYRLINGSIITSADDKKAGNASGRFYIDQSALSLQPLTNALFASKNEPGSFTIRFFIKPTVVENNEILIYWSNTTQNGDRFDYQSVICGIEDRRLVWSFERLFKNAAPQIEIKGKSKIKAGEWSFHSLSYNRDLNFLEYSMNGRAEQIVYLSPEGSESEIDTPPIIGSRPYSVLTVCRRFSGKMDELMILNQATDSAAVPQLLKDEGRILFRCVDTGYSNSLIENIVTDVQTEGNSAVNGYFRISENRLDSIRWNEAKIDDSDGYFSENEWIPFRSNDFPQNVRGRYLQVAVQLLPDTIDGISPQFKSADVVYEPNLPPLPPIALTAIAGNEAVTLDWIPAVDIRTRGYRISYGTAPGRYTDFIDINNPPFTPNRHQQFTITGLQNDVLYYFSVQSFDDAPVRQYGEFSDEISARPGLIHKQP